MIISTHFRNNLQIVPDFSKKKRAFALRSNGFSVFSGIAAAAVLFVFVGAITVSAAEVSRVTLTAGASVTYGVNIFDRVISVSANNEEGRLIIDEISGDVMFRKLPDAFETILDSIKDGEYIDDENPVIVLLYEDDTHGEFAVASIGDRFFVGGISEDLTEHPEKGWEGIRITFNDGTTVNYYTPSEGEDYGDVNGKTLYPAKELDESTAEEVLEMMKTPF